MLDGMNDISSSTKQIRVRSRDRSRHRDRERGRDPDHRRRSSTLPDLATAGVVAADDDGNGDKPWFKKKTLWASVATMVGSIRRIFMGTSSWALSKSMVTNNTRQPSRQPQ